VPLELERAFYAFPNILIVDIVGVLGGDFDATAAEGARYSLSPGMRLISFYTGT
jgi:hypothetical protein